MASPFREPKRGKEDQKNRLEHLVRLLHLPYQRRLLLRFQTLNWLNFIQPLRNTTDSWKLKRRPLLNRSHPWENLLHGLTKLKTFPQMFKNDLNLMIRLRVLNWKESYKQKKLHRQKRRLANN